MIQKNYFLAFLFFLSCFFVSAQTTYYSKSTGNLNTLATWGTNTNGTGTSPTNFTSAGCTYIITNTSLGTISAAWTVSGAGSQVVVGNGSTATTFSIPATAAFSGTVSVSNNATLTILNTTIPTFSTLASGSTVEYARAGGQNVVARTYHNLVISGSGQKSMTNVANVSITNSLIINAGCMLRFPNSTTFTTTITGSVSGAGSIRGDASTNLVIAGSGNLGTLTFSTTLSLFQLTIARTSGSVTLGSNLTVSNNFVHTSGSFNLGSSLLTLNGGITFPTSAANGEFVGTATSSLAIGNTTAVINNRLLFNQSSSANRSLNRFTLNRAAQTFSLGNNLEVLNAFVHSTGILHLNGNALSISGILSFPTSTTNGYMIGSNSSSLSILGAGAVANTLKFDPTSPLGRSLSNFQLNHTVGIITLGTGLNCIGTFAHTNGTLSIGANLLSLQGPITFPAAATNGSITGATSSSLEIIGSGGITNNLFFNQSSTANRSLSYFAFNRGGQTLALGNSVIISNFIHSNGLISLGSALVTFNGAITFPTSISNGAFVGSTTASLAISTSAAAITNALIFVQTTSTTRSVNNFNFNRAGSTLNLGSDMEVLSSFVHSNGILNLNGTSFSASGVLVFPAAIANGYFIGSATSSIKIGGSGAVTNTFKMDQTTLANSTLSNFKLEHLGGILTLGNNLTCVTSFIHSSGTLSIGTSSLTLSGSITFPPSLASGSITGSATSSLTINGSGAITGSLVMNQSSATARTLNNLSLSRAAETVVLGNALIVNTLQHTNGRLSLNGTLFTVNGAITFPATISNGAIVGSLTSSLTIAGTGAITNSMLMDQGSAASRSLYDALLSRTGQTLSIGNLLEVRNSIRPSAGTIVTNSFVTLKSDATRSAMVGNVTGAMSGAIGVETYAPGGSTGWVNIGPSGVTGLTLANWETQFFMTCVGCTNGTTSTGGFASVIGYNETLSGSAAYVPLTYTSALTRGIGYWVYLGTGSSTTAPITYSVLGPVATGNVVLPISNSANSGYNLMANPYASPIDWDLVVADAANSNVNGSVYFYNPDLGQTISYASGVSSPSGYITNGTIPMGQGFYVQATTNTNITFRESHKSTANTSANPLLRPASNDSVGTVFRLSILGAQLDYDETVIRFHPEATPGYDRLLDARKQFQTPGYAGTGPVYDHYTTISSKAFNDDLSINSLPNTNTADIVIPILAKTMFSGTYTISPIDIDNFVPNTCVTLRDKLTGTDHDLRTGAYKFSISDTTSAPRFELRLCAGAVPVALQALTANKSHVKMVQTKLSTVVVATSYDKAVTSVVSAYNTLGQAIIAEQKLEGAEASIELDLEAYRGQIITVKVSNENGHTVKKFAIY